MKSWFSKRDRLLAGTIIAGASVLGFAAPAHAQDAAVEDEEAIVVTGSRIARANLTSPTAVTTVDAQAIELSGQDNIAEILRGVPSFGASAISSGNSNFFTQNNGINTLQLRNLGENRTLVLVNGRRYVSGVPASTVVDLNTVPTDLLERVEVITGGASAIYGADALAGVINMILRDDFEGLEARYQYGESKDGDDINNRFSILAGGNFADGRGNAVINAVFTQNQGSFARDHEGNGIDNTASCALTGGNQPGTCQTRVDGTFSSFSEFGRFVDYYSGGLRTCSSGVGPSCTVVPFSTAAHGFNRQAHRRWTVPIERFLLSAIGSYEINPGVEFFTETTFAHTVAESDLEPFPMSSGSTAPYACSNPFVPPAMVAQLCDDEVFANNGGLPNANGNTHQPQIIPWRRRMVEAGTRGQRAHRNTYRVLLGLRGDFADRYHWETFYSYGQTENDQISGGQINVPNMREALNAIDPDGAGPLQPICANPIAVADGCVPVNLFGRGAITDAAVAWIQAPVQRQAFNRQEIASATLSGPLFAVPAGDVEFAAGVEWRREHAEDIPDALTQTGQNAGNIALPTIGGYNVGEIFAEVEVPLLRDMPLVHELSVGGAFRWSDYNLSGETEAYTGRINYAPTEWLRFRAQYARAVRVPNVGELFAPAGENFATVQDLCNGVTTVDVAGDLDNNCRLEPTIAARLASPTSDPDGAGPLPNTFTLTLSEQQGTGGFTGGGNTGLAPETADSYNVGFVANHDFGGPGNVTFSVDWYKIEITDRIRTLLRNETINRCYNVPAADFSLASQFCQNLVRFNTGPAGGRGALTQVNTTFFNDATANQFSGIDTSILWNFALSDMFGSAPGDVSFRLAWTHLLYETSDQAANDTTGQIESPENKIQAGVTYSAGPWLFSWETNFLSSMYPNLDPTSEQHFRTGSYMTHDVRIGWDVSESANIYVGANNVLDEEAPVVLSGITGNTTGFNTDANIYDPFGRRWYAGVRLRY